MTIFELLIFEFSVGILFLYYNLFLKGRSIPFVDRLLLLTLPIVAWSITLIPSLLPSAVRIPALGLDVIVVGEGSGGPVPHGTGSEDLVSWVFYIWMTGVLIRGFLLAWRVGSIIHMLRTGKRESHRGTELIRVDRRNGAFSFFGYIMIGREVEPTTELIIHEKAHGKGFHSLDLIVMEVFHCILWFDPFLPFIKRSLRTAHEHLADREVMANGFSPVSYSSYLLENAIDKYEPVLVHRMMDKHQLKQRIRMIHSAPSHREAVLRYLCMVPLTIGLLFIASCDPSKDPMKGEKKESSKNVVENPDRPPSFDQDGKSIGTYLSSKITYPEEAKEKGIEGTVFIGFTVSSNGAIRDVKVKKGVHEILDQEAKKVVRNMPDWTPGEKDGEPVPVRLTLPVKFKSQ